MEKQQNYSKTNGKDVSQIKDLSSISRYVLATETRLSTSHPLENSEIHKDIKESGVTFDL